MDGEGGRNACLAEKPCWHLEGRLITTTHISKTGVVAHILKADSDSPYCNSQWTRGVEKSTWQILRTVPTLGHSSIDIQT